MLPKQSTDLGLDAAAALQHLSQESSSGFDPLYVVVSGFQLVFASRPSYISLHMVHSGAQHRNSSSVRECCHITILRCVTPQTVLCKTLGQLGECCFQNDGMLFPPCKYKIARYMYTGRPRKTSISYNY